MTFWNACLFLEILIGEQDDINDINVCEQNKRSCCIFYAVTLIIFDHVSIEFLLARKKIFKSVRVK